MLRLVIHILNTSTMISHCFHLYNVLISDELLILPAYIQAICLHQQYCNTLLIKLSVLVVKHDIQEQCTKYTVLVCLIQQESILLAIEIITINSSK